MAHGAYRLVTFINQDNNRTATWMGRYGSSGTVEPATAQQIRNWINTQTIWRISGDSKRTK